MRRTFAWVAASMLHALAAWLLRPLAIHPSENRPSTVVEVEVHTVPPEVQTTRAPAERRAAFPASKGSEGTAGLRSSRGRAPEPPIVLAPSALGRSAAQNLHAPASSVESAEAVAPAQPAAPDLFPSGVLQKFSTTATPNWGGRTLNLGNRDAVEAEERGRAEAARKTRVARWVKREMAQNDAAQGRIAPVWRNMERELTETFQPPPELVRDGGRLRTGARQYLAALAGGAEERVRQPQVFGRRQQDDTFAGKSVDPSQQGFLGDPPGLNLRSGGLEQQFAAQQALSQPASWTEVEIEVETDDAGEVRAANIVMSSGRRAFDRYALEAVKKRVQNGRPEPRTLSHWRVAAAESVDMQIGATFDENAIFDKRARKRNSLNFPLHRHVRTRVQLAWVEKLEG